MGIFKNIADVVTGTNPGPGPKALPDPFKPHHAIELKIKSMSLAAEARIIRRWENRLKKAKRHHPELESKFWSLRGHRIYDVGGEARATYLAYGFLKGKAYKTMEAKRYSNPNWERIHQMAHKYGKDGVWAKPPAVQVLAQHFEQWKQEAGEPAVRSNEPKPKKMRVAKKKAATA